MQVEKKLVFLLFAGFWPIFANFATTKKLFQKSI